jgi:hypothetical protein
VRAQKALLGDTFTPTQYNDRVSGGEEEQAEPRRPRVVDKRVSSRAPEPIPAPGEAAPAEPAANPDPEPLVTEDVAEPADPAQATAATPAQAPGGGTEDAVWTPEREAEAQAIAEELSRVPAIDWVANAAITLANVAAAKIQMGQAPDAQFAIDALAALVDGMGSRLGEAEQPLRQTLAQLRMAYAQSVMPPTQPGQPGAPPSV